MCLSVNFSQRIWFLPAQPVNRSKAKVVKPPQGFTNAVWRPSSHGASQMSEGTTGWTLATWKLCYMMCCTSCHFLHLRERMRGIWTGSRQETSMTPSAPTGICSFSILFYFCAEKLDGICFLKTLICCLGFWKKKNQFQEVGYCQSSSILSAEMWKQHRARGAVSWFQKAFQFNMCGGRWNQWIKVKVLTNGGNKCACWRREVLQNLDKSLI